MQGHILMYLHGTLEKSLHALTLGDLLAFLSLVV